jgi:hypothetical protein
MRRFRTHFEQVSLAAVRKLAKEAVDRRQPSRGNVIVESPLAKTEPYSIPSDSLARAATKRRG